MRNAFAIWLALAFCAAVAEAQQNFYSLRRSTGSSRSAKLISSRFNANGQETAKAGNGMEPQNDEAISRAVVDLALNIGRSAGTSVDSAAEIFSPVSIMGVINMLLLAADGTTRNELMTALRMDNKGKLNDYHRRASALTNNLLAKDPKQLDQLAWRAASCISEDYSDEADQTVVPLKPKELKLANAMFVQRDLPVSDKFTRLSKTMYGADIQLMNFQNALAASTTMNNWVKEATNGKIRELTGGLYSADTSMIIASSLYFKASWLTEFTAKATRPKDFFPDGLGSAPFKVNMMTITECLPYHFEKSMGLRMIGLPYSDNATTMYVLMPQESTVVKLRTLQKQLTATKLDSMISSMKRRTSTMSFPRMQLKSTTNLEKSFRHLGIKSIFSAQSSNLQQALNPDYASRIPLYVSQINHKVLLGVDEQGTEGAAVTVALTDRSSSAVYFNTNQPFLIYVRHDPTRLPLFYGAVFDPRG